MAVPRAHLDERIDLLKTHFTGKVAGLMFYLDEVGSANWEDRKTNKIVTPAAVGKEDVYHPVSRRYRNATLPACALHRVTLRLD
jgi:hypothetical protein